MPSISFSRQKTPRSLKQTCKRSNMLEFKRGLWSVGPTLRAPEPPFASWLIFFFFPVLCVATTTTKQPYLLQVCCPISSLCPLPYFPLKSIFTWANKEQQLRKAESTPSAPCPFFLTMTKPKVREILLKGVSKRAPKGAPTSASAAVKAEKKRRGRLQRDPQKGASASGQAERKKGDKPEKAKAKKQKKPILKGQFAIPQLEDCCCVSAATETPEAEASPAELQREAAKEKEGNGGGDKKQFFWKDGKNRKLLRALQSYAVDEKCFPVQASPALQKETKEVAVEFISSALMASGRGFRKEISLETMERAKPKRCRF